MTRPALRRPHLVGRRTGDDEGAREIDVDDLAPMLEVDIVPGDEGHDAGIVDQYVDAAGATETPGSGAIWAMGRPSCSAMASPTRGAGGRDRWRGRRRWLSRHCAAHAGLWEQYGA